MCPELVHLRLSGPRHSVSGPFIVGVRSAVLCADPRVRRVRMAGSRQFDALRSGWSGHGT